MKTSLFFKAALAATAAFLAEKATGQIANLQPPVIDDEKIELTFDLEDIGHQKRFFEVKIVCSDPAVVARSVIGTGKRVVAGKDRKVIWRFALDGYSKNQIVQWSIYPTAVRTETAIDSDKRFAVKQVAALVGAAGGGFFFNFGVQKEQLAQRFYESYKSNDRPFDDFPTKILIEGEHFDSREALFDRANSIHKSAQAYKIVGATVAAASLGYFARNWAARKKKKKPRADGLGFSSGDLFLGPAFIAFSLKF